MNNDPWLDQIARRLEAHTWFFASTMADNPHWYTLKKHDWKPAEFEFMVGLIQHLGTPDYFGDRMYIALEVGGYHYWTMGYIPTGTDLINRKPLALPPPPYGNVYPAKLEPLARAPSARQPG